MNVRAILSAVAVALSFSIFGLSDRSVPFSISTASAQGGGGTPRDSSSDSDRRAKIAVLRAKIESNNREVWESMRKLWLCGHVSTDEWNGYTYRWSKVNHNLSKDLTADDLAAQRELDRFSIAVGERASAHEKAFQCVPRRN